MNLPRCEHPKPQFERTQWCNLNGQWQFEIDNSRSGTEKGFFKPDFPFSQSITVPFCPESRLSGIGHRDFMAGVWYKREFTVTKEQSENRIFLHFGAVDYIARVYINGETVGMHKGGYSSFSFEITPFVKAGANSLTVYAEDDTRDVSVPSGKQCHLPESAGCHYTRTTGIWQTVWLEFVPENYIKSVEFRPELQTQSVSLRAELHGEGPFRATVFYAGQQVGFAEYPKVGDTVSCQIALSELHLWELGAGRLYDVVLTFGTDCVKSYFGMRQVKTDDNRFLLNGKSVFQRLVLDQGFYPDGIYTAPSDEALRQDIALSMACGFNGARLHQKVFEERFLYHCDKAGYMVWGEYPSWGTNLKEAAAFYNILPEWMEIVKRDFNHPSIIGWCPCNETTYGEDFSDGQQMLQHDRSISSLYLVTKAMDETRPCIDASGWFHVVKNHYAFRSFEHTPNRNGIFSPVSDIYDLHDYAQDVELFRENLSGILSGAPHDRFASRQRYDGGPLFISEYGGIGWNLEEGWGYGNQPKDEEEFFARLEGLTDALLDNANICGFCYTQLTDIEQEQNGLVYYNRTPKFDLKRYHRIFAKKAAIED